MYDYCPIINCIRCGKRLPNLIDPHLCNDIMRGGRGLYWNDEVTKLRTDNTKFREALKNIRTSFYKEGSDGSSAIRMLQIAEEALK